MKPLAIDLFCGLGGWTEGFLAAGFDVVGFDIQRHRYDGEEYPAQLILQDARTISGAALARDPRLAAIIASSPCQKYSYMAMPWTKAKNLAKWYRDPRHPERLAELNELFEQPRRIQREACEAAGRYIPLVQENVRGAIPWVGRSRWHYGSYHLWGDVPALMPITTRRVMKEGVSHRANGETNFHGSAERAIKVPGLRFDGSGKSFQSAAVQEGFKTAGMNWSNRELRGQDFTRIAGEQAGTKNNGRSWFNIGSPGQKVVNRNPTRGHPETTDGGTNIGGDWFSDPTSTCRRHGSKSSARKAASARIAKIPFPLAFWIATVFRPPAQEERTNE